MKALKILSLAIVLAAGSASAAQASCLPYNKPVTLVGNVISQIGYGWDRGIRKPEPYYALVFSYSDCVSEFTANPENEDEDNVQVLMMTADAKYSTILRRSIGKRVTVTGTLWHGYSGHHHTNVLINVTNVR